MRLLPRRTNLIITVLLLLGGFLGIVIGTRIGIRYIPYVSASVGIASLLYVIYWTGDSWQPQLDDGRLRKVVDLGIFAGIVGLSILSRHSPGIPDVFYWVLVAVFLLIIFRVLAAPSKLAIIQILLFATILRGTLWQSAPVIRHDPRLHVGISEFILQNGELLTDPNYYYRDFPVAHVLSATTSMITELPIKQAYFLSLGVPAVLGLIAIFAVTRRLATKNYSLRPGLLAMVFLSTAAAHVAFTGYPITQTLTLILHATALFLAVQPDDNRLKAIVLGYVGVLSLTHNSAVISLSLLFGALLLSGQLAKRVQRRYDELQPSIRNVSLWVVILVGGIATAEFLYQVGYFQTQFRRVLAVFIYGSENAVTDISGASFGGAAYTLADPILHIGIGLFVTTVGLIFGALVAIGRIQGGDRSEMALIWVPAALLLFGIVGIGIVVAGTGRITRIRPEVLLVVAPVVGVALDRLANRKLGVIAVCLLLLTTPILATVAAEQNYRNPLTSPTNRAADDYTNHLSAAELAALTFAADTTASIRSGAYITDTAAFRNIPNGLVKIEKELPRNNITYSDLTACNATVLYRSSYQFYPGVDRPNSMNTIYDSGEASMIQCPD